MLNPAQQNSVCLGNAEMDEPTRDVTGITESLKPQLR